jgi:hypothetical protein
LHLGQIVEGDQAPWIKPWTPRRCPSAMRSVVLMAGLVDMPTHRLVQQPGLLPMGFSVLSAVEPTAVITGFCLGGASSADQPLAQTFFDLRAHPNPRLLTSVGWAFWGAYVAYSKASRRRRKPSPLARLLRGTGNPSAQAQLQKALVQARAS